MNHVPFPSTLIRFHFAVVTVRDLVTQAWRNEPDFPADHHHFRAHPLQSFRRRLTAVLDDHEIRRSTLAYRAFPVGEPKDGRGSGGHHLEQFLSRELVHVPRKFDLID